MFSHYLTGDDNVGQSAPAGTQLLPPVGRGEQGTRLPTVRLLKIGDEGLAVSLSTPGSAARLLQFGDARIKVGEIISPFASFASDACQNPVWPIIDEAAATSF